MKPKGARQREEFPVLTTLLPGGQPQRQVMWVDAGDDHLLMNTELHRQKFKKIERDPKVTVTIVKADDSYSYAEVRGRLAEIVRDDATRAHRRALTQVHG